MQRCQPVLVLGCCIRRHVRFDQELCELNVTPKGHPMQRRPPVPRLGCCIGAMLEWEPRELQMTPFGRPMQRRPPVLGLGCRVGAVFDQKACELQIAPLGHPIQRRPPVLDLGCYVVLWLICLAVRRALLGRIQGQTARWCFLRSNSCFIPSSAFCDTSSKRACSSQCLEAYSARGNLVRLSGDVFVQVQKSRIFRRSGKKSRIHSLNSAKTVRLENC